MAREAQHQEQCKHGDLPPPLPDLSCRFDHRGDGIDELIRAVDKARQCAVAARRDAEEAQAVLSGALGARRNGHHLDARPPPKPRPKSKLKTGRELRLERYLVADQRYVTAHRLLIKAARALLNE